VKKVEFAALMKKVFDEEINKLREAGQKEYAGGDAEDAFTNFNKLATELATDRKKVLWTYAMKHKDGIAAFLRGEVSQREPVEGRINDLIVYLFLLRGMIEEEKPAVASNSVLGKVTTATLSLPKK
jgi:hypothetical protein